MKAAYDVGVNFFDCAEGYASEPHRSAIAVFLS